MQTELEQYEDEPRPDSNQIEGVIKQRQRASEIRKTVFNAASKLIVIAAAVVLIATLFFPTVSVQRGSMIPTLLDGDNIVVMTIGGVGRGDIVAFNLGNKAMVMRIIAGPGQWVDIDSRGVVFVDREAIREPYLINLSQGICDVRLPMQVPDNQYFVMGDNRAISIDSRAQDFGTVHKDEIIGKAIFRIWPLDRIGLF